MNRSDWLEPDWPALPGVRAAVTLRTGGVSAGAYASLNLGQHVGDDPKSVEENRRRVAQALDLPSRPFWLTQVHGCGVADVQSATERCEADASIATIPGRVCAVLTADCLPLLMARRDGEGVAAVHAGWRGLAAGVIENALHRLGGDPGDVQVWMGPAIGPQAFEVGDEVREVFTGQDTDADACFSPGHEDRWMADIYGLARRRLENAGAGFVGGGGYCTVSDPERFFSYRRDGVTGRMASLIWIEP